MAVKVENTFGPAILTPKGKLFFFDLDTPNTVEKHPNNLYPSDRYDITMGFEKSVDLSALKAACTDVAVKAFGSADGIAMPFANGDEKSSTSMHGHIIIRAKSTKRPGLVDTQRQRICEEEVRAGMFGRLQLTPMSYVSGRDKSVTLLLKNTQVFVDQEYEALGGGESAESAFGGDNEFKDFN